MIDLGTIIYDLENSGFKIKKIKQINGGINSHTYKLDTLSENKYILKIYKSNKSNSINRLNNEQKFLHFLDECNIKNVPKLIKVNLEKNWLLMSWIDGEKIKNVNYKRCKELLDFIFKMQNYRLSKSALNLNSASDSYSSLKDHIFSVNNRLKEIKKRYEELILINKDFPYYIKNLIEKIKFEIINLTEYQEKNNIDIKYILPKEKRIISQSDVGFHNIIFLNKRSFFIDFEYGGWDDPSKLFCDLILQPDYNIPIQYIDVLESFFKKFIYEKNFKKSRLIFMLKLCRIKWSLIILNPILLKRDLAKDDLMELLNFIINKSSNYLEESLKRINYVNIKFLKDFD